MLQRSALGASFFAARFAECHRRADGLLLLQGHLNPVARLAVGSGPMANIF